jgi:hypothetical protein
LAVVAEFEQMTLPATVEERLTQVEAELARLKSQVEAKPPKRGWLDAITGTFKDDPDFDEILRLGRELRQADRPPE